MLSKMKMRKEFKVPISLCDDRSLMSYPAIFSLFMDLASEHGPEIGLGLDDLGKKNLFWLTVKTKVKVHRRPDMLTPVAASTWPEKPGRVRCNRYYTLHCGEELLAEGKTEWALIDTVSGRLCRFADVYPQDLPHIDDTVCDEAFTRIGEDFSDSVCLGTYTVKSTDIDLGRHMNNAAYVKALFGFFTTGQLAKMDITDIEVTFKNACFEGEELQVYRRDANDGCEIGFIKADGKSAFLAKLKY